MLGFVRLSGEWLGLRLEHRIKMMITGGLGHMGAHVNRQISIYFHGAKVLIEDNIATRRYSSFFNLPARRSRAFFQAHFRT